MRLSTSAVDDPTERFGESGSGDQITLGLNCILQRLNPVRRDCCVPLQSSGDNKLDFDRSDKIAWVSQSVLGFSESFEEA